MQKIGEGWDAVVFRTDHGDIIKAAKREESTDLLATEALVLELIRDRLPARTPRLVAAPDPAEAWPPGYIVHGFVSGAPLHEIETENTDIAAELGAALRQLHGMAVDRSMQIHLPLLDRREWAGEFGAHALRKIAERRGAEVASQIANEATRILRTSDYYDVDPALIHNDLHGEHLLFEPGQPVGIIDWGDAGLGDPDVDFLYLHWTMDSEFMDACINAYEHKNPEGLRRKLDDLLLLLAMFLIFMAGEYGSEEEEASGWELLDDWINR